MSYGPGTEAFVQSYAGQPFRAFALDFWNGSPTQCETFRSNAGITYPVLMRAGTYGIGTLFATSYDAFFVVDGDGVIRYRRALPQGAPAWRPAEVGPAVDAAIADLLAAADGDVPQAGFRLLEAYPNPFNPRTRIPYRLDGAGGDARVSLQILDLRGRVLRTLVSQVQATGRDYEAVWDGRDDAGNTLPSGTYLSNLVVDGQAQARFLTLIK